MKPNIYDTNVYVQRIKQKYPSLSPKDLSSLVSKIDAKLNEKAYNEVVKQGGLDIVNKVKDKAARASLARDIMLSGGVQSYRQNLPLDELITDPERTSMGEQTNLATDIRRTQPLFAEDNNMGGTGPIAAAIPGFLVSPKTRDQRASAARIRANYQRAVSGLTVSDAEAKRLEAFLPTDTKTEQQNREDLQRLATGIQINQELFKLAKINNLTPNEAYEKFGKEVFEKFGESWDGTISQDGNYSKSALQGLGEGILGFGRGIVKPIEKSIGNIGTGIAVPIQSAVASLVEKTDPQQAAQIASGDFLGTRTRAEQISQKAQDKGAGAALFEEGVKPSLGTASFAVPFGKGATLASKALIPGAASGALYSASEEGATPESVVGGAVTGGLFASAFSVLGSKFGSRGAKAVEKAAAGKTNPLAKTAIKGMFEIPKNKATSRLNMDKVAETVIKHDFLRNASSYDDLANKANEVVNLIEPIKRDALSKVSDVEIPNMIRNLERKLKSAGVGLTKRKAIKESIIGILGGAKQTQIGKINAIDGYDMVKQLEDLADGYIKTGISGNPTARQSGKAISNMSQEILDQLDDKLANVPLGALKEKVLPEISRYSPQLADDLAAAKTFRDFRAIQAGFVQLAEASRLTSEGTSRILQRTGRNTVLQGIGALLGSLVGNVPGAIFGAATAPAAGSLIGAASEKTTLPATRLFSNLVNKKLPGLPSNIIPESLKKVAPNISVATLIKLLGGKN